MGYAPPGSYIYNLFAEEKNSLPLPKKFCDKVVERFPEINLSYLKGESDEIIDIAKQEERILNEKIDELDVATVTNLKLYARIGETNELLKELIKLNSNKIK